MSTSWRIDGDCCYFENDLVHGRYLAAGHYQGMRSLVHRPSGIEVAAGERLPGLVAPYRVFANGRRYGDVRDRQARMELTSDGVAITHAADAENPLDVVSRYSWNGNTLDVHYTITLHADMRAFEIGVASYLSAGFRAYVSRQSNEWGETAAKIVPVDVNPLTDVYALFPRDETALKTIFDGRWDLPPYPVRYAVPAYFAQPMAWRRHAASGVVAVGMADPQACYAVCIPVNNPAEVPDPANGYQGVYFYLFGRDLRQGETVRTRVRWIVGQGMSDEEILGHWEAFAANA